MTIAEHLREEASKLRHAVSREVEVFDAEGKLIEIHKPTHYLTCERCKLERKANELERNSTN